MARGQRGIRKNAEYKCDHCGELIIGLKAYYILQHQRQQPERKGFCSQECLRSFRQSEKIVLGCENCGNRFERNKSDIVSEHNFCSQSCSAIFNNKKYVKIKKQDKDNVLIRANKLQVVIRKCLCCKKDFEVYKGKSKFCSSACDVRYRNEQRIGQWKETGISPRGNGSVSSFIRRYLFDKYGHKCSRCGWHEINPITEKSPLEVEHIDGNSENNVEANLTLLCPNCHSITPTYKALNKGHGRFNRRQRYQSGKSF